MAKQVIDIVPAGEIPVTVRPAKQKEVQAPKKVKQKKIRPVSTKRKRPIRVLLLVVVVLIVAAGAAAGVLTWQSKLVVTVYPVLESIVITEEIEASTARGQIDLDNKIVPAEIFETEQEKWSTFLSSGSDTEGAKAEGIIIVHNNHNPPRAVTLVENTRFLSAKEGKTFRVVSKVSIPPATLQGGKIVPSTADAKVIAQEGGDSYNIGPSQFSVPGLAGSALYYSVWGESEISMAGGFSSTVKRVSKDDLEKAEKVLREGLEETIGSALDQEAPEGVSVESGSVLLEDFEASCFQEEGEKVAEFNCYGKAKASGLGIKDDDLQEMGLQFINNSISSSQQLVRDSLEVSVTAKSALTEAGSMIFDFDIKGSLYKIINEDMLVSAIADKDKDSIKNIVGREYPQIKTLELNFWPFWVKKSPKNLDKIKVEWILEK